ncbi:alpha/beta hydrolase [Chitinophaga sp. HK235]|uniref:alpha/beta hydrolase n=1 Tax=Chitinophaga sp. HK235 TaxID=2952571 RepID=UPI001BA9ACA9|nr:alpha/beta hydrolase [Chitinophaga sp. HK235]
MQNQTTIPVAPATPLDPATDPRIESNTKAFLNALNAGDGKPIEQLSPVDARAVLTGAQSSIQVDLSGVEVSEKNITHGGQTVKLHIVKPQGKTGILPVFMFFHGGGWVLGDFPTHQRLVRDLVVASEAAAVFVDYTPSPEAHYPVAINQAFAATQWVATQGGEIGVDSKRLAVVGNSVGGNMAAVIALKANEMKGPAIKLQVLMWPVTDANFNTDSYQEFATGRFLTKNMMKWFWDNYITDEKERRQIYASPLQATHEQLKGLPPAVVLTAGNDVLRDEGEAYARKMDEAGVAVTAMRYNGMIHDWGLLNPLATIPGTRSAMLMVGSELKKALA